jgi:hypothetical protein
MNDSNVRSLYSGSYGGSGERLLPDNPENY